MTLKETAGNGLPIKKVIGKGSFLIYLSIAIAGYYYLREQVATTSSDFRQLQIATINYTKVDEAVISEPTFYLTDSSGSVIDKEKGIKAEAFYPMKVLAGSAFRVREIEVILSRGTSRLASMTSTNEVSILGGTLAPGDRVTIIIKRVLKTTPTGDQEVAFKNGIIKILVL